MSQIERCQSKWCNVNSFKRIKLVTRQSRWYKCWGKYIIWMHTQFYLCQEVNWFVIIYFWYAFFYHPVSHEMCANGIPCTCFTLAFGLMVLGFTNANWYAQLRYLKVMITEIVEGPYSINNIDLYSNYSGNNIVSLNLSFLVLTCKAILWQKSNLSNHKESCSVFIMNLRHCLNLRFTFVFASSYSVFSWAMSRCHCNFVLGFSSQRTSLHCTIIRQHCTQLQDTRCECV